MTGRSLPKIRKSRAGRTEELNQQNGGAVGTQRGGEKELIRIDPIRAEVETGRLVDRRQRDNGQRFRDGDGPRGACGRRVFAVIGQRQFVIRRDISNRAGRIAVVRVIGGVVFIRACVMVQDQTKLVARRGHDGPMGAVRNQGDQEESL